MNHRELKITLRLTAVFRCSAEHIIRANTATFTNNTLKCSSSSFGVFLKNRGTLEELVYRTKGGLYSCSFCVMSEAEAPRPPSLSEGDVTARHYKGCFPSRAAIAHASLK